MGAEMVFATARYPWDESGKTIAHNDLEAWDIIRARGIEMIWEDLDDLYIELDHLFGWEGSETRTEIAEDITTALDEGLTAMRLETTDTSVGYFPDPDPENRSRRPWAEWAVTGGMTGGDEPTDSFKGIQLICELGITEQPIPARGYES